MKSEPVLTLGLRTGRGRVSARALRTFAQWLMRQIPDFEPDRWAAISIVVTGDEDIAATNQNFLGHTGPTDVITFAFPPLPGTQGWTGEIHVNLEQALAEARVRTVDPAGELAFYIAHGFDHLCGHDDATPRQRAAMHRRERAWLRAAGRARILKPLLRPA